MISIMEQIAINYHERCQIFSYEKLASKDYVCSYRDMKYFEIYEYCFGPAALVYSRGWSVAIG